MSDHLAIAFALGLTRLRPRHMLICLAEQMLRALQHMQIWDGAFLRASRPGIRSLNHLVNAQQQRPWARRRCALKGPIDIQITETVSSNTDLRASKQVRMQGFCADSLVRFLSLAERVLRAERLGDVRSLSESGRYQQQHLQSRRQRLAALSTGLPAASVISLPTTGATITSTTLQAASGSGATATGENCLVLGGISQVDPAAPAINFQVNRGSPISAQAEIGARALTSSRPCRTRMPVSALVTDLTCPGAGFASTRMKRGDNMTTTPMRMLAASCVGVALSACGGDDDAVSDIPTPSVATPATFAGDCATLATLPVANGAITSATRFRPAPWSPAIPFRALPPGRPDELRVGTDGKNYAIGFEVRLPKAWNGRFLFQGGGGNDGAIGAALACCWRWLARGLQTGWPVQGYAVVTTDGGHQEPTPASASINRRASTTRTTPTIRSRWRRRI